MHTHTAHESQSPSTVPTYREDTLGYVAHCKGCGTYYTAETWQELPLMGTVDNRDGTWCEMRDCTCRPERSRYTLGAELEVMP